jgi:hypothetical protein
MHIIQIDHWIVSKYPESVIVCGYLYTYLGFLLVATSMIAPV